MLWRSFFLLMGVFALIVCAAPFAAAQIGGGERPVVIRPPKADKKAELPNQALEEMPRPPQALAVEATRLSFVNVPLSNRGLLSQQSREALRTLIAQLRGAQVVRLRAFVAGSGDLRRIPQLVAEQFFEKHLALPVVTAVQVGALPMEGAQVLFEATLAQSKAVNPNGVQFLSAKGASVPEALGKMKPAGELLRATCYVPLLDGIAPLEGVTLVQPRRIGGGAEITCEGVVRSASVGLRGMLVMTGAQLAFSYSPEDAKLALERLEKTLKSANSTLKNAVFLSFYPLSSQLAEMAERISQNWLDPQRAPAGLRGVVFDGLPSIDGSFAVEAVATVEARK